MSAVVDMLRESLHRLGNPAAMQVEYLQGLGTWPSADELALEFDDVAVAAVLDLPVEAARAVAELDAMLDAMSGPSPVWDGESLHTAPEWEQVRELARKALAALDAERVATRS